MAKLATKKAAKAGKSTKKFDEGSLYTTYDQVKENVEKMETELRKFVDEQVKASAKRARSHAQEIRKLCGQLRKDIMEVVKQRRDAK